MPNSDFNFQWVTCDGGPLLLVEEKYLSAWEGSDEPSENRQVEAKSRWNIEGVATDYDRACDVECWLGLIEIGEGKGLVLGGDESFSTTWLPLSENISGMLIRWDFAESEGDLIKIAKLAMKESANEDILMNVKDSDLILLAACESADDEIYPRLRIKLPSGKYGISTVEIEDESTSVICHMFRKIAESEN